MARTEKTDGFPDPYRTTASPGGRGTPHTAPASHRRERHPQSHSLRDGIGHGDPQPYRPLAIPGTIQAEDYNLGGEGVAYHDSTPGNEGGAYRHDDVDIETGNGVTNVGWIRNGEFLTYTANVTAAGARCEGKTVTDVKSYNKVLMPEVGERSDIARMTKELEDGINEAQKKAQAAATGAAAPGATPAGATPGK